MAGLLCSALLWLLPADAVAVDYEYLEFEVSYKGRVSSNKEIKVAKAVWNALPAVRQENADLSLRVSSEKYQKLESLFPFRLCHIASYSPKRRRTDSFETFMRAGKEMESLKVRFDWSAMALRRESAKAKMHNRRSDPFDLFGGVTRSKINWRRSSGRYPVGKVLLDRISMLQHLRKMRLKDGQVINVPVSDGKRELEYWVSVSSDRLSGVMGKTWSAFKLNFETFDLDPKRDKPIHPPVDIWISSDNRRLPLRLAGNYPFGRLDARLVRIGKSRRHEVECKEWQGFRR
jgi:hypothetical protein